MDKTAQLPGVEHAGDRECQACGSVGSPVLGSTGPACSACGSYSLLKAPHQHPGPSIRTDYTRTSSLHEAGYWTPYIEEAKEHGHSPSYTDGGGLRCDNCGFRNHEMDDPCPTHRGEYKGGSRKTATRFETNVASADGRILINPGDQISTPTGQTMNVNQVRRHETSRDHYYVDTDAGTTVVPYSTKFTVVPQNSQQQSMPDLGTPGGNWATDRPHAGGGTSGEAPKGDTCPVCGQRDSLTRRGDKYVCSRCGYNEAFMGGSGPGQSFSDATQQTVQPTRRRASINDHRSVIARHAAMVAGEEEETPL